MLFDPQLKPLHIDQNKVNILYATTHLFYSIGMQISGILENNGHSVVYRTASENDYPLLAPISTPPTGFKFKDNRKFEVSSLPQSDGDSHNQREDEAQSGSNDSGHHHQPPNSHHHPHHHHASVTEAIVTISGGPLSYRYNFDSIYLHFGRTDVFGSEHVVAGVSFPAEVRTFYCTLYFLLFRFCITLFKYNFFHILPST